MERVEGRDDGRQDVKRTRNVVAFFSFLLLLSWLENTVKRKKMEIEGEGSARIF